MAGLWCADLQFLWKSDSLKLASLNPEVCIFLICGAKIPYRHYRLLQFTAPACDSRMPQRNRSERYIPSRATA
jgi:hypothetical protein